LGVTVESAGNRVIIAIDCRVDMAYVEDSYDEYGYEDDYEDDYEDEEEDHDEGARFVAEDELLNLLVQVRKQIIDRDYRVLYAVWEKYGFDDECDENVIPIPPDKKSGRNIVEQFRNMLE